MAAPTGSRPPSAEQRRVVNRLKRAYGQLAAVIAAVEAGADCRDVVTQLSAVGGALNRAGFEVISLAMRECLSGSEPATEGDSATLTARRAMTLEEVGKLFLTLA